MCNTVTLSFPSLIYSPDVYTNEKPSVGLFKEKLFYSINPLNVVKLYTSEVSLFKVYCWICNIAICTFNLHAICTFINYNVSN